MPEYLSPGVYVEEYESGAVPMEGVGTSTAGFVGLAEKGDVIGKPQLVTSFSDYVRISAVIFPRRSTATRDSCRMRSSTFSSTEAPGLLL